MRKDGYCLLASLFFGLSVCPTVGHAITINDNTLVLEGHSRSTMVADWVDVIGASDVFGVYGIDVERSGNSMQFSLQTNFSGEHHFVTKSDGTLYNYYMADFAIDSDRDGFFDLGVVLQDHSQMSLGTAPSAPHLAVGLYAVNAWDTSSHFFEESGVGPAGGIGYGEWYYFGGNVLQPMVSIADGSLLESLAVTRTTATGMTDPRYTYSFAFDASHLNSNEVDLFWGGANCANDAIAATVPEPGTMLLFGTGLFGLVGAGRKKFARNHKSK